MEGSFLFVLRVGNESLLKELSFAISPGYWHYVIVASLTHRSRRFISTISNHFTGSFDVLEAIFMFVWMLYKSPESFVDFYQLS